MSELLNFEANPWMLSLLAVGVLLFIWLLYRLFGRRSSDFDKAIEDIGYDRIEGLVIPDADGGEILVDYLILTSKGLLIVDVKNVRGAVFGGDKLHDWAVISKERRYTFPNPQPALYDRIAAVRQIVRQVPVAGRILFLDGAEFTKGVPAMVCDLDEMVRDFGEPDKNAAKSKIEAFKPYWGLISKVALGTEVGPLLDPNG